MHRAVSQAVQSVGRPRHRLLRRVGLHPLSGHARVAMFIVKIILAIFLPPVAAFLQVGVSLHLWINIILTLLGGLPGLAHALWLVLTDQSS